VSVSALIAVIFSIGIVWNLPNSAIQRVLTAPLEPIASATGLSQRWQMYAPEPLRRLEDVEVRVIMDDGSHRVWTNPRGDAVVGPFNWYRWQKLKENVVRDENIRADVAHWAARTLTEPGERVDRLLIVMTTTQLTPPGSRETEAVGRELLFDQAYTGRP
jgi:hypothetical protein